MIVHNKRTRDLLAERLAAMPEPALIIRIALHDVQDIWPKVDDPEPLL